MTGSTQPDKARHSTAPLQMPHQAPPINRTTTPAGALDNNPGIEADGLITMIFKAARKHL